MKFQEALKTLGIEEYSDRIFKSNSRGELFHIQQYFTLAETIGETNWFADWFAKVVEYAEKNWERPESVFQHIDKILLNHINKAV